jgi:hypothetical protein
MPLLSRGKLHNFVDSDYQVPSIVPYSGTSSCLQCREALSCYIERGCMLFVRLAPLPPRASVPDSPPRATPLSSTYRKIRAHHAFCLYLVVTVIETHLHLASTAHIIDPSFSYICTNSFTPSLITIFVTLPSCDNHQHGASICQTDCR